MFGGGRGWGGGVETPLGTLGLCLLMGRLWKNRFLGSVATGWQENTDR